MLYTSSEPSLCMAALRRHSIDTVFEQILFAQELDLEKRYADSFVRLSQMLNAWPEACVLLDDSPVAWSSARGAGTSSAYMTNFLQNNKRKSKRCVNAIFIILTS